MLTLVPFAMAQKSLDSNSGLSVEGELLLEVLLDGQNLNTTILAYQKENDIFLSLRELMEVIEFPIKTDAQGGQAGGWFIEEQREFLLDLRKNLAISNGQKFSPNENAVLFQQEIFVSLQALEEWFPLKFEPLIRRLVIDIRPEEPLPIQEKFSRRSSRVFGVGAMQRDPVLPLQENPYQLIGPVAADIRLNTSSALQDEESSTSFRGNYSVLSRGDLAWMTSTIALTGSDDDGVSNGRLKLERQLDRPFLMLDYVEVGDVDSGSRGILVRGGGAEKGVQGTFTDDFIDLRGDIPPDWEVELYRNGVLVDAQIVGNDAQYEFLNVPLEFGQNVFEFVFYGPFGEQKRDERIVYAGDGLEFGELSYSMSALQDGQSMIAGFPSNVKGTEGTARFLGAFNLGLGGPFSARLNVDSFEQDGDRLQDYGVGLSATFEGVQTSLGFNSSARDRDSVSALVKGRLSKSTSASLRYSEFLDGNLDEESLSDSRALWTVNGVLSTKVFNVPISLTASRFERKTSNDSVADLGATFSNRWGRLSKSFFYSRSENDGSVEESSGGSLRVSFQQRPWSFRVGSSYNLSPESEVVALSSAANIRLDRNMSFNANVRHQLENNYTNSRMGLNWGLGHFQISPQVSYDSNDVWLGLLTLSTSFNSGPNGFDPVLDRLPQTSHGAARARVFLDEDGDGLWSGEERGLSGVRIDAIQAFKTARTSDAGKADLIRLREDQTTDISIDVDSLPELGMISTRPGVSIKPRPGSWSTIDFPIIRTMELEGYVFERLPSSSEPQPMPRVVIELINQDDEVISRQRTVFDGFFLFSGVPPGRYRLSLNDQLEGRILEKPEDVVVTSSGGVIRDLNFTLGLEDNAGLVETEAFSSPEKSRNSIDDSSTRETQKTDDRPAGLSGEFLQQQPPRSDVAPARLIGSASDQTGNDWFVQFGAFSVRENALLRWTQLRDSGVMPEGQAPRYQRSGGLIRLLNDVGLSEAEARSLCAQVKAQEAGDCLVRQIDD